MRKSIPYVLALVIVAGLNHLDLSSLHPRIGHVITGAHAQTVISDGTYEPAAWSVSVVTAFGAGETHEQRLTDGNPGAFRYMELILPPPPGPNDVVSVQVTHIYEAQFHLPSNGIDHIDFSEDIRLLNLPYEGAFRSSYPLIRQDGRFYRTSAQKFIVQVIGHTQWTSGSLTELIANDFTAMDGSGDHPDFSAQGDTLFFGFWRALSRSATLPTFPANQVLTLEHGSDNFTVTIHEPTAQNRPPVARDDLIVVFGLPAPQRLGVLANDYDPDGDGISISSFTLDDPFFGTLSHTLDFSALLYTPGQGFENYDYFTYTITDGQFTDEANVTVLVDCGCIEECLEEFTGLTKAQQDTVDLALLRRLRDEVLASSEDGARYIDIYYKSTPEILKILLIDRPDLGAQAIRMVETLQPAFRNLLEGDGSAPITQAQMDTVARFFASLSATGSDSLQQLLAEELSNLGPLNDYVGLPVSEAISTAIGDSLATAVRDNSPTILTDFVLQQNYPNPFNPSTQISYHLPRAAHVRVTIYDLQGKKIKTLVDEWQSAGENSLVWNGLNEQSVEVASGVYFYRLKVGDGAFQKTRKMLLLR